ncbi:MAG: transposase [Nitrososphaerota archaeon]|jgi:transposase|nr:transposase [Nitrososphaerota archaeon]
MFVGLDLHKNYIQAAVVDDNGKLLKEKRIPNGDREILSFFEDEMLKDGSDIVMESSSTWYHVYDLLSRAQGNHIILSNPVKTKAIASARVKTDKLDARALANLLRGGYIPECYIPSREVLDLREMVRYRASLVRARTRIKNKVHSILLMNEVEVEHGPFAKEFIEELRKLND